MKILLDKFANFYNNYFKIIKRITLIGLEWNFNDLKVHTYIVIVLRFGYPLLINYNGIYLFYN